MAMVLRFDFGVNWGSQQSGDIPFSLELLSNCWKDFVVNSFK